ncbi:MAG: oleate hydratase, partial [Candidatus Coproplasma sp.]
IRAHKPEGIETKKAHIIGGGIAGLASAVFLIDDGYMDGKNVTIYEQLPDVGGSMDGATNQHGYTSRGERELEPNMECLWYLCSKIPSLTEPGRTVLEETVDANREYKIYANRRVLYKQGKNYEEISDFKMSPKLSAKMIEMMTVPEEEVENVSIEEFFGDTAEELYQSSMWICFHSMLAFKHYHSLIEMKRYMIRFIHHLPGIEHLRGQVELKWNQYDALIKPIKVWLKERGVNMICDCTVYDLDMDKKANTVTAIKAKSQGNEMAIEVAESDIVILTLGSMTQNSCMGDNKTIAVTNRNDKSRGLFTVWENLALKDKKFGNPEKFISDIDKTKWMSVFPTTKGYPEFHKRMRKLLDSKEGGSSGAVTILDSNWEISFVLYGKYFPDQADDEQVFWFDGLYGERNGNYIKKPMAECTGEEILTEFLYHLGMLDIKDEVLSHTYVSTCMMPYITSQFMPRAIKDRPLVQPEGCTNLALIGQYVELPGDVVFTVETSVRTAMMAAYGLLKLDRPVAPLYTPHYDIRIVAMCLKKMLGTDKLKKSDLPPINPLKMNSEIEKLLQAINSIPVVNDDDIIY